MMSTEVAKDQLYQAKRVVNWRKTGAIMETVAAETAVVLCNVM